MFLFLWLTVSVTAFGSTQPSFRSVSLRDLCSQDGLVQFGACSPHFVECSQRIGVVRSCPIRGEVFSQGVCRPAGTDCHDSSISLLNEETNRLAGQLAVCRVTDAPAIYTAATLCSRQALLCEQGRAVAVACPNGYTMQGDLSCGPSSPECYGQPTTDIRDLFLQQLCTSPAGYREQSVAQQQSQTCNSWYVNCLPRPSIVRCPAGSIFNGSISRCRPWQQGDQCIMAGSCYGREYQSISVADCQSVYLYCDGLQGKYLYCPDGMVFNGVNCVPPETANCPICQQGETRPSPTCSEYHLCEGNAWVSKTCPQGSAWNQERRECVASYTCTTPSACQYGSVTLVSCGKALVCNGQGFDEVVCPPNTMFDAREKKCVYSTTCNVHSCGEGDVMLTPDCGGYRLCRRSRYKLYPCRDRKRRVSDYCKNCGQQTPYLPAMTSYPAQCSDGSLQTSQSDCSLYFQCSGGQWNQQRCPADQVFSSQWLKCVPPQYGEGCSIAIEPQCQEGERVYNPSSTDCSHLVECQSARWVEMTCPQGYVYDSDSKSCITGQCPSTPSEIVHFPGTPEPQPPAPPPVDDGYGINCVEGEQAVDPFDCTKYLACRNGQMVTEFCPAGSGYNPSSRSCQTGYLCGAECQEGVYIPLPTCGQYRYCLQGRYIDGHCNHNKVFSNGQCTDQDCRPTYFVPDCNEGAVLPPQQLNPNPAVFMTCVNGKWEERSCPDGSVFNFQILVCEQQSAPLPPATCYARDTRQISCQEYEVCHYNEWKRQNCPYGQKFSNGICVPGGCGETCVESAYAYRRDAYDCSKYYQCVHGKWMQRPCAPGTVFNERALVCDWARNVPECGGTY